MKVLILVPSTFLSGALAVINDATHTDDVNTIQVKASEASDLPESDRVFEFQHLSLKLDTSVVNTPVGPEGSAFLYYRNEEDLYNAIKMIIFAVQGGLV